MYVLLHYVQDGMFCVWLRIPITAQLQGSTEEYAERPYTQYISIRAMPVCADSALTCDDAGCAGCIPGVRPFLT
jgi:hypothetical protein